MQHKTRLKLIFIIKMLLCMIMVFFMFMGFLWAYSNVFKPSYVSVMSGCGIKSVQSMGYVTRGSFVVGSLDKSKNGIKIYYPEKYDDSWQSRNAYKETKEYQRFMKHEKIHQWQYSKVGSSVLGCNHKFIRYLSEVHAYVGQWF